MGTPDTPHASFAASWAGIEPTKDALLQISGAGYRRVRSLGFILIIISPATYLTAASKLPPDGAMLCVWTRDGLRGPAVPLQGKHFFVKGRLD
jgi:hypothetical protein